MLGLWLITSSHLTFKPDEMRDSCPDDFNELEPKDEELLDAFDVIDTAASSHPTAIPQCSAPTAPNSCLVSPKHGYHNLYCTPVTGANKASNSGTGILVPSTQLPFNTVYTFPLKDGQKTSKFSSTSHLPITYCESEVGRTKLRILPIQQQHQNEALAVPRNAVDPDAPVAPKRPRKRRPTFGSSSEPVSTERFTRSD
jgi:hypothetical protein